MDQDQLSPTPPIAEKTKTKLGMIHLVLGMVAVVLISGGIFLFLRSQESSLSTISLWGEIKPGIVSREEVIQKLGGSAKTVRQEESEVLTYPSENDLLPNLIFINTQTNKVDLIIKHVDEKENLRFPDFTKTYGQPEKEMYNRYGFFSKTYIWASKGVAAIGNKNTDQVFEVAYFTPMTLADYLQKYGQGLSEENPYTM